MEHCGAVMKVLLLLTFSVHPSSAATHTLQYFYTAVTGLNFPEYTVVGLLDGERFVYYDSNIRKAIPKTEWMKKITADDPYYWDKETERQQGRQERFKINVATAMQSFNQTKGVHIWQRMHGCELDDDGTTRGYTQYGCDGEDFMSLDLKAVSWTAAKPQAVMTENKWESTGHEAKHCKDFLKYECIELLKKFVSYSRETLMRKVRPEASVFQKHSPSPEVVCHATGFFPKAVMISWQKDGADVQEDVELRETLPNQDGSFQKRSILTVTAEELQKHTYTCVIQHSSLEKVLVLPVSERRNAGGGGSDGEVEGVQIDIIVGVVVALIALVASVAGILLWKKSGFKAVPQNSTSSYEGDSSSNNS